MAWSPAATVHGNCKISQGTLDGSDDNFTFDPKMIRWWLSLPAHAVTFYNATASSGNKGFIFPLVSVVTAEMRDMGLAGKQVTFVGTSSDVLCVMEELTGGVTA